MPADLGYLDRLVEAFTDLMRRERTTSITDGEIAERVGRLVGRPITSQVAGRWVAGKVKPRDDAERKALADVLGVQAGWLYWNEGSKRPQDVVALPIEPPMVEPDPALDRRVTPGELDAARSLAARIAAKKNKRPNQHNG